jgi:outer membrane protein OmpU
MEINMKKLTKVGLSALAGALAFTSANAGEVSIAGSMIASYTKTGGHNTTTGNPIGMNKELTITGSGELDNGTTVAYKQTVTNAMAYNDSELVFTGLPMAMGGTVAITSTGGPLDAIDDKTPIAFEEASAAVGSLKDVSGVNGTYGLRYTLSDVGGSGIGIDAMYSPKHGDGDAAAEKGTAGSVNNEAKSGYDIVVSGAVPAVDGLSFGLGYSNKENSTENVIAKDTDDNEGTVYVNYAFGGFKIGAQRGVVSQTGADHTNYDNEYIGISYAMTDNLSVSYNEIESRKSAGGVDVTQEFDSISLSYTAGGMTIGLLDAEADNTSYTSGKSTTARAIQMSVAF